MKLPSHNPILNARRFRLLALENLERAQSAKSVPKRWHHRTLAKHYLFMTESEVEAANKQKPYDRRAESSSTRFSGVSELLPLR
jgi:hypothetical protein